MGGDVYQWNEATLTIPWFAWRRLGQLLHDLASSSGSGNAPDETSDFGVGFRVASLAVPEPGSITLVVAGGLCLLAYAWRRRQDSVAV